MKRQVIEVLSGKGNTSALTTNDLFILVTDQFNHILNFPQYLIYLNKQLSSLLLEPINHLK